MYVTIKPFKNPIFMHNRARLLKIIAAKDGYILSELREEVQHLSVFP